MSTQAASRPHDDAVVGLLRADPAFANEYLAAALEEAQEPGGQAALLAALRHIAETQGMGTVAERAGMPRESLYRALSPRGNPTIKTVANGPTPMKWGRTSSRVTSRHLDGVCL